MKQAKCVWKKEPIFDIDIPSCFKNLMQELWKGSAISKFVCYRFLITPPVLYIKWIRKLFEIFFWFFQRAKIGCEICLRQNRKRRSFLRQFETQMIKNMKFQISVDFHLKYFGHFQRYFKLPPFQNFWWIIKGQRPVLTVFLHWGGM